MDEAKFRALRLRHHRLNAPARTVTDAARHMLCVQAQDYWGGRLALAARTRSAVGSDVDAAFDDGVLVRAWTQRGTLHIVPAADLRWVLSVTAERTLAQSATRRVELELDEPTLARAHRVLADVLRGGNALTRAEVLAAWEAAGISTSAGRGYHLLFYFALDGLICWGPSVSRDAGTAREQRVVLVEEWVPATEAPEDPLAEFFTRYVIGHGPVTPEDFAWWAGLPKGPARAAAARADARVREIDTGLYAATAPPRRSPSAAELYALPSFEEFYIGYADRSRVAPAEIRRIIGPAKNGMVSPILIRDGEIIGRWRPPPPAQRATADPEVELFATAEVASALERAMAALRH